MSTFCTSKLQDCDDDDDNNNNNNNNNNNTFSLLKYVTLPIKRNTK